jgi:hypothetical protein
LVYAPGHDVWSTGTISGRFRDRMITLDEAYDDTSGTCTRITLGLIEPSGGQLTLHPRPPVESDQPSFACTFIVEGEPQDFAEQVFASTDLQQNLMLAHTQHTPIHELKLQGWGLSLLTPGILQDTAPFLSHCCDLLSDIADRIEDLAATTA